MSERPDLEVIRAAAEPATIHSDTQGWLAGHLIEVIDYALQVEQEHADYAEHTVVSHRYMVDEVDRLERQVAEARERMDEEPRCHPHRYATSETSRWYRDEAGREVEVRPYPDDTVDEIVTGEIHLEQMDHNNYWMRINGVTFSIRARGKITLTYEPDTAREIIVPIEETCEGNGCGIFGTLAAAP